MENCKSNVCSKTSYLDLRKNLNLTLKQFKTKISVLNIEFKDEYSDEEVEKITSFVNSKLSKADLRDLPYINEGWIPLRKIREEINISSGTLDSYVKILNINVYKPLHQLSFISKEDREKIFNFIKEHENPTERKIYLSEQTCLEKFGVTNGAKSEEVRKIISQKSTENAKERLDKAKQTNLDKYGVSNYFKIWNVKEYWNNLSDEEKEIRNKKISDSKIKYRFEEPDKIYAFDLSSILNKDYSGVVKTMQQLNIYHKDENHIYIYKNEFSIIENFYKTTEMSGTSYLEKELLDFIKSIYSEEIVENSKKIISPLELDIYIPNKKVAIEFNGLYWHDESHVGQKYHLNKTLACNSKGIDLIHVFEDDWKYKKEIVKSMIASRLGIYERKIFARKCEVKEVDKYKAESFLNENHLQGFASTSNIHLGLFYNDELVQMISITNKGFHDGNTELTRMATKLNIQVIGGFSKLMKNFCKLYNCDNITSYIYRAWFNGNGYKECNFKIVKENKPSYFYIVKDRKVHRSCFRKDKIKRMFEVGELNYWNENETEKELMLKNEIRRIYDCGTTKIIYQR